MSVDSVQKGRNDLQGENYSYKIKTRFGEEKNPNHLKIIARFIILPIRTPVRRKGGWQLTAARTWCRKFCLLMWSCFKS